jgi:xylose isomerase
MDAYALALKIALKIRADGKLEKFVEDRYASYDSGYGREIDKKKTGFKELEKLVLTKLGEPKPRSGRQEYLENLVNTYLHA